MFFTQEDYLKIEKWLKARAVKDSQFPELTDYDQPNSDDYFVILQGNKTNAKVKVTKAFLHIYNELQNRPILRGSGNYSLITDSKWTTRPNEASGEGSIAIGLGNNKASKYLSVAIGQNNIVDSQFSWGLGSDNNIRSVDGYNKVFGNNNIINTGSRNYIIGDNNNLQYSSYNYVFGLNNHISGSNSSAVIIGSNNNGSDGGSSIYIGKGLEGTANDGIASINLGQYNINIPGNRYLFTIGNGKDGNRSNALSIEYNGDINIQNIGSKTLQAYLKDLETLKQNKLIAGAGIAISSDNTISCILDTTIFVVVDTLPLVPEDTNINKIHLVKDTTVSGNLYSEYLYVNNTWEKLGDFQPSVDLSEYAKTADIPVEKGTGNNSIVQKGGSNSASGTYSSAFGFSTRSTGNASHTEGISTIAQNAFEHAEGRGNLSIKDKTVHTVGIGSLDGRDRKNAEEIHRSGDKYVIGIGGYDGTNSQTEGIKTVQEVVEESANAVQITYTELKSLRDTGKLVPGTQYRITDYTCTTTQAGTKSAGHVFDIIVTADDESTLNEVARAVKHDGDVYFAKNNLSAWKIYYRLDNDTNRFAWADATNGKGVIYRMIDEFNNDCPYDFKNIQFKHPNDATTYPYYYYTFASDNIESNTDCSLKANYCYSNTIREYVDLNKRILNSIIFVGDHCFGNSFGTNCYSNTFGNTCICNSFGTNCYSNTFGSYLQYNSFGNYCYSNTLGRSCRLNNFGAYCYFNTFGSDCEYNTFGNRCHGNVLGSICYSNSFGNECEYNTLGNYCHYNSFGNSCYYIKFASDKSATTKYNYYQENHFENGCHYIIFTGIEPASSSAWVQNYNFAQGLEGTYDAHLTIDGKRNRAYETYISRDTDGTIKESVIAEFENKLGNCVDLTSEQTITGVKTFDGEYTGVKRLIFKAEYPDDIFSSSIGFDGPTYGDEYNTFIIGDDHGKRARLRIAAADNENFSPIDDTEVITLGYLRKINASNKEYVDTQITEVGEGMVAMQDAFNSAYAELGTEINSLTEKTTSLDSRTPVDSKISFLNPSELFPEYSEDTQDVQNYILPGFLQINNQMTSVDGLFNYIRDNNLAGKAAYFTIYGSLGNPSVAIIGNIDTGAVGYKISFSTISRYSDNTNFNNRLIFFEIEIGDPFGDGIIIMNSRLMNICIKDTLSQIDNNSSKIQTLEAKNTELTNTITTLESRIAELENIISQITIKEE